MKYCAYCGKEYPDDVEFCPADHHTLQPEGESAVAGSSTVDVVPSDEISPDEKRFWERMTFRQFAILLIRIQAVWMFFNGLTEATLLTRYLGMVSRVSVFEALSSFEKRELFMLLFRVFLHFVVGILLIQKAEKILSWLVKDYVSASPAKSR